MVVWQFKVTSRSDQFLSTCKLLEMMERESGRVPSVQKVQSSDKIVRFVTLLISLIYKRDFLIATLK